MKTIYSNLNLNKIHICNCIKEIQTKALDLKYKEQPILKAEFLSAAFLFDTKSKVSLKASGLMELTVEGRKKPVTQQVVYNYCPFCGKKYPE